MFRHQFAEFHDDYRVVAFDLPGHGVSPNGDPEDDYNVEAYAKIVHDVVEALDLGTPAICGTPPINKFPDDMPRGYIATPHMELEGKRFHSPREKYNYATHTIGMPKGAEPLLWQAVWRTDGLAREQAFAKQKTSDWPRQMRVMRDGTVPFAMINGRGDPFINLAYCRSLTYGRIWNGCAAKYRHGRPCAVPGGSGDFRPDAALFPCLDDRARRRTGLNRFIVSARM